MSLDITLTANRPTEVYTANITHNLNTMAEEAGLYIYLWRPEELWCFLAGDLIIPLTNGLKRLENEKEWLKTFNPKNGWGDYDNLVEFVKNYLIACQENPGAKITAER